MQLTSGHLYEFGPFVLDTARHLLLREGNPVPLTPKTYDLLRVLVDSYVEESNLTQQISAVRKALGESAGEDRYIVTVPGKGYRFAATVTEPVVIDRTRPASRRPRALMVASAVAAIVILLVLGYS